jgi:aromatic-L-amino-acid decarboxylase
LLLLLQHQASNEATEKLLGRLNERQKIFMVPTKLRDKFSIRFAVCARTTEERHIDEAWEEIKVAAAEILDQTKPKTFTRNYIFYRQQS